MGYWMKGWLILVALLAAPAAMAEPWLCTDVNGIKSFSYDPASAGMKNCVNHPIPSGNVWRVRPPEERATGAGFPTVDEKTQRQRDATRRRILERELAEEKKSLAAALQQLEALRKTSAAEADRGRLAGTLKPVEDRVRVHQANIANLERELGEKG